MKELIIKFHDVSGEEFHLYLKEKEFNCDNYRTAVCLI